MESEPLSGTVGNMLDPIVSLRWTVELAVGGEAQVAFLLGVASEREAALALAINPPLSPLKKGGDATEPFASLPPYFKGGGAERRGDRQGCCVNARRIDIAAIGNHE